MDEFNNLVENIKTTLGKTATELAQKTAQSAQAKQDLDDKRWVREFPWQDKGRTNAASSWVTFPLLNRFRSRLDAARKRYAVLKRRLETEFQQLDTMELKVQELDNMRKAEEMRLKAALKLNEDLKKDQFKRSQ